MPADGLALVYGDERNTYGELREQVDRLAGGLAARGSLTAPRWRWCCPTCRLSRSPSSRSCAPARGGAAQPALQGGRARVPLPGVRRRAVITDEAGEPRLPSVAEGLDPAPELVDLDSIEDGTLPRAPGADDDAVFQYSSGSTGGPKRVPRRTRTCAPRPTATSRHGPNGEDSISARSPSSTPTAWAAACSPRCERGDADPVRQPQPFVLAARRELARSSASGPPFSLGCRSTSACWRRRPRTPTCPRCRLCFSRPQRCRGRPSRRSSTASGCRSRELYGCTEAGCVTVNADPDPRDTIGSVGTPIDGRRAAHRRRRRRAGRRRADRRRRISAARR